MSNRLCHGYGTKPAVFQTDPRNKNSPPLSHPNPKVICPLIQTSSSVTHDLIYHLRFKIWHVLLGMTRKNKDISAEFWALSICVSAPWCLFTHIRYIYHKSKTLIRPLPKILDRLILWQPHCSKGRVSCHSFGKKKYFRPCLENISHTCMVTENSSFFFFKIQNENMKLVLEKSNKETLFWNYSEIYLSFNYKFISSWFNSKVFVIWNWPNDIYRFFNIHIFIETEL